MQRLLPRHRRDAAVTRPHPSAQVLFLGRLLMGRGQLRLVDSPSAEVVDKVLRRLEHGAEHLTEKAFRQNVGVQRQVPAELAISGLSTEEEMYRREMDPSTSLLIDRLEPRMQCLGALHEAAVQQTLSSLILHGSELDPVK